MRSARPAWLPTEISYATTRVPGRIQRRLLYNAGLPVEMLFDLRGLEVVHCTDLHPLRSRLPVVVTVYDVAWRSMGSAYHSVVDPVWIRNAERAIRRASHICAISTATADELIGAGVDRAKVTVTRLGVDDRFAAVTASDADIVRTRHALPDTFVLFLGAMNVRKNVGTLIRALQSIDGAPTLVVAGPRPDDSESARMLASVPSVHLGYLPDADIPGLLRAATVLVFPSHLEGFGLPLLEGMAAGVPVLASDIPPFVEVGGSAPQYFDPNSSATLADALRRILRSSDLRLEMSALGQAQSRLFTWRECRDSTMRAYHCALRS